MKLYSSVCSSTITKHVRASVHVKRGTVDHLHLIKETHISFAITSQSANYKISTTKIQILTQPQQIGNQSTVPPSKSRRNDMKMEKEIKKKKKRRMKKREVLHY